MSSTLLDRIKAEHLELETRVCALRSYLDSLSLDLKDPQRNLLRWVQVDLIAVEMGVSSMRRRLAEGV